MTIATVGIILLLPILSLLKVVDPIFQAIENKRVPSFEELEEAMVIFDNATKAIRYDIDELEYEYNPTFGDWWVRQKRKIQYWKRRNFKRKLPKKQEQNA